MGTGNGFGFNRGGFGIGINSQSETTIDVWFNRPWLTQTLSYSSGDEGSRVINGANDYNESIPAGAILQQVDFTSNLDDKLKYFNYFGNKFRFTGLTGGYYDPSTGLYYTAEGVLSDKDTEFPPFTASIYWIIDNLTGIQFPSQGLSNCSFSQNLINAAAASWDGHTDYYALSIMEQYTWSSSSYELVNRAAYRPPFNSSNNQWTCSVWAFIPTTNALSFSGTICGFAQQQAYTFPSWNEFYGRTALTGFVTQPIT